MRWRDDRTNADPAQATRNRLRLEVLPLLERTMGREVKPALWRTADILRAEEAWLAGIVREGGPLTRELPLALLSGEPIALQRRRIRRWLHEAGATGIGYQEVELVRSMLDKKVGPAKVNLPGAWHARRKGGILFLEAGESPLKKPKAGIKT